MRRLLAIVIALVGIAADATAVRADDTATEHDAKQSARRHLKLGVTLFQEGNFTGALAEFEASYRDLPSAAALQNIALCYTKLFRYVEAIDTLNWLQRDFGNTLPEAERQAVQQALQNLSLLVGTLRIDVSPKHALVTMNEAPVPPRLLDSPMRLSSGEYRISATAPGFRPDEQVIKVAGGEQKSVSIKLEPLFAQVAIHAGDPDAAIAIDRQPLAYGSWFGQLAPGSHLLQVYKAGHAPYARHILVRAGDSLELRIPASAVVQPQESEDSPLSELPYDDPDHEPLPRGFYGMATAATLAVLSSPDGFAPGQGADTTGSSFGLRGGYRLGRHVVLEAMFERGSQSVTGTYQRGLSPMQTLSYDLTSSRAGANVRLVAGGRVTRLSGALGVGAVVHDLELAGVAYEGTNSYATLDVGVQFNVGHVLIETAAQSFFEGVTNVKAGERRAYTDHSVVSHAGLALRIGYSEWGQW